MSDIGPNRARAWVVTVVNPVLSGLARAKFYLASGNWTWRYRTESFEVIYPPSALVPIPYHANLEDLLASQELIATSFAEYERSLEGLAGACASAHAGLVGNPAFQEAVRSATDRYGRDPEIAKRGDVAWWGALPEEEASQLAAERVVNDHSGDPYATDAGFWARFGSELLAFRQDPGLRSLFDALEERGRSALASLSDVESKLTELRRRLGSEHDLPPVPV